MQPILIIDPGHGGKDNGGGTNEIFKEKDMNLKISLYQYKRFIELGLQAAITRNKDIDIAPLSRTEIVKKSGAKYCISNHINAASNNDARGVETIYSIHSDGKLAIKLLDAIANEGMPKRRAFSKASAEIAGKDYYYMHRDTGAVETVIIEYGFATNENDTQLLVNKWEKYAEAAVKAFCEYVGHKYEAPKQNDQEKQKEQTAQDKLPIITDSAKINYNNNILPAYITNEGKTVAEVRALAEMLNLTVSWDGSTNTVLLKDKK